MNKTMKDKVWEHAKIIRGKDANLYRQDPYGNILYKNSYGKASEMGWEIDHIQPKSRGGSDELSNLQALKTSVNRAKGNSLVKRSRHAKGRRWLIIWPFFAVIVGFLYFFGGI